MSEGTGRILKPTKFHVNPTPESRVYPDARPDNYGQVNTSDRDKSRMGGSASQANEAHYRTDTDASQKALHHTLGTGRNQASPGNHQHDGITSSFLGPWEINPAFNPALPVNDTTNPQYRPVWTCAATVASIRTLLHNFIDFRDV